MTSSPTPTPDVYAQHSAHFSRTSAFVIMLGSVRVATIAIRYPADGDGRLYAYLHIVGGPMVRGSATGGGYDKHSAAISCAAKKVDLYNYLSPADPGLFMRAQSLIDALSDDGGQS